MRRHSKNIKVNQLLQTTHLTDSATKFNDFGNFFYKDHVTMKKYQVNKLKSSQHKTTKSAHNFSKLYNFQETFRQKKWQLTHFLQQLVMNNQIKENRNYIVSGNQKIQRRRSFVLALPKLNSHKNNLDKIKQKIRKEVDQVNYQFLRDYLRDQMPYRGILGQLNKISNTGALTSQRIKKIKRTINKCQEKDSQIAIMEANHQLVKIDEKENFQFERYFGQVWKNLEMQIKLKVKHDTAFNWKHGRKQDVQDMVKFCKQLQTKRQQYQLPKLSD